MQQRTIGSGPTSTEVSVLCLGTMHFGTHTPRETAFEVLDRFVDAGGTFLDTANNYNAWDAGGHGHESEDVIGAWLASRGLRDRVRIATKCGAGKKDPALPLSNTPPTNYRGPGRRDHPPRGRHEPAPPGRRPARRLLRARGRPRHRPGGDRRRVRQAGRRRADRRAGDLQRHDVAGRRGARDRRPPGRRAVRPRAAAGQLRVPEPDAVPVQLGVGRPARLRRVHGGRRPPAARGDGVLTAAPGGVHARRQAAVRRRRPPEQPAPGRGAARGRARGRAPRRTRSRSRGCSAGRRRSSRSSGRTRSRSSTSRWARSTSCSTTSCARGSTRPDDVVSRRWRGVVP